MISYPVPPNTCVVLHHDAPIHHDYGDSYLVYVTWTGEDWVLIRLNIGPGTVETGPLYRSFIEAKRAHDAGAVKWEARRV